MPKIRRFQPTLLAAACLLATTVHAQTAPRVPAASAVLEKVEVTGRH